MQVPRAAALLAALLLSGCMSFVTCPGCESHRNVEGVLPGLYEGLAEANATGAARLSGYALGFDFDASLPDLDAATTGGRLRRIEWLPDGPEAPRGASAAPLHGQAQETLVIHIEVAAGAPPEDVRAVLDAFLPQVHEANESVRETVMAQFLMHGPSHTTFRRSGTSYEPDIPLDVYFATVKGPHRVESLFGTLRPHDPPALQPPARGSAVGYALMRSDAWHLLFSFPVRTATYEAEGVRVRVDVDGRGAYLAQLDTEVGTRDADAQETLVRVLVETMRVPDTLAHAIRIAGD